MVPKKGERYKHYKGDEYIILGVGTHTETNEQLVIYRSNKSPFVWIRPLEMFVEIINIGGEMKPRFRKMIYGNEYNFHNS